MDSRTGTPPVNQNQNQNQNYGLRESDGDVQGMLALQQGGFPASSPQRRPSDLMSPTSSYSQEQVLDYPLFHTDLTFSSELLPSQPQQQQQSSLQPNQYAPARSGWSQDRQNSDNSKNSTNSRGLSPIMDSPVEMPAQLSQVGGFVPPQHVHSNSIERSSDYYEDVDPKFAEPRPNPPPMPSSLMPGGMPGAYSSSSNLLGVNGQQPPPPQLSDPNLPRTSSYDDLPDGSRSPAASEASHFTSVSQRPVNPAWRPEMGAAAGNFGPYGGPGNGRGGRPMRPEDVILDANAANPDFAIPGVGMGRGRGRGGFRGRGRGGMQPPATMMGPQNGLQAPGRYPGANAM
jgi:hypothetical protein